MDVTSTVSLDHYHRQLSFILPMSTRSVCHEVLLASSTLYPASASHPSLVSREMFLLHPLQTVL